MTRKKQAKEDANGSQIELPKLPSSWCWVTLHDLAATTPNAITDGPFGSNLKTSHYTSSGPRVIRLQNIGDGVFVDEYAHVSQEHFLRLAKHEIRAGDIAIAALGETLPRSCVVPSWVGPAIVKADCPRLKPDLNLVLPEFVNFALNSPETRHRTSSIIHGVGRPRLNLSEIREIRLPLAPLNEQRRIVAKIEELFSDLDAGVAALERIRANLKRYRAAVLKAAVEGKFTEEWRAKHPRTEPATKLLERILAERRQKWEEDQLAKFAAAGKTPPKGWREKYVNPAAPDTSGLPELPHGWCWATVEQVSEFAKYGSSAKTSTDFAGVPVLRMGNIQDGSLDLGNLKYLPEDHDEFPDLLLRDGDLLFNRTNSAELVGKSAVYHGSPNPCSYASYLIAVRTVCGCNPEYVCYYLNSWYGRAWIASVVSQQVGQANVNGTKLQALVFPLPPEAEQSQIVAEVELRVSNIAAADAQVDTNAKRAACLRQSILKRAFDGKLVPQDPNDEPAEKLLERIRQERANMNGSVAAKARKGRASGQQEVETHGAPT